MRASNQTSDSMRIRNDSNPICHALARRDARSCPSAKLSKPQTVDKKLFSYINMCENTSSYR